MKIKVAPQKTGFRQGEQRLKRIPLPLKQKERFRDDRLAGIYDGWGVLGLFSRPGMMLLFADEIRQQRAGVRQPNFHWPKPSKYFGLVARSLGPPRQMPAKCLMRS